jgi:hypothetical protein
MFQTPEANVLFPPFPTWAHQRADAGHLIRAEHACKGPMASGRRKGNGPTGAVASKE